MLQLTYGAWFNKRAVERTQDIFAGYPCVLFHKICIPAIKRKDGLDRQRKLQSYTGSKFKKIHQYRTFTILSR